MIGAAQSWQSDLNAAFCGGLQHVDLPAPAGLKAWHGQGVAKRFQVYRNNVYSGLVDALAAQFPVVQQLVGDEFFRDMARVFVVQALPETPRLLEYGGGFPKFIAGFSPAEDLPYLADVAQLEWLWSRAYHAAEADSLTAEALAQIPPEAMGNVQFTFHPSCQLMRSDYPVVSIWAAHQGDGDLSEISATAEAALIIRPEAEVMVLSIQPESLPLIAALRDGHALSDAIAMAYDEQNPFDLSLCLSTLIHNGCLVDYNLGAPHE